jgi:hypothetical protein
MENTASNSSIAACVSVPAKYGVFIVPLFSSSGSTIPAFCRYVTVL